MWSESAGHGNLSPTAQHDWDMALTFAPRRVRVQKTALYRMEHVPSFCRRDAILEGYRQTTRWEHALTSLWRVHNETFSIWSHLIGACIIALLAIAFATSVHSVFDFVLLVKTGRVSPHSQRLTAARVPKLPILLMDMCCTTTLLLSATAHTFSCMPRAVSATLWRLDQAGIGLGMLGCFIPGVLYSFYCHPPGTGFRYLSITWFMATACALANVVMSRWVSTRFLRAVRVASYVLLACTAVLPMSEVLTSQAGSCALRQAMLGIGACAGLAGAGGFFYASGIPERWRPGKFDLLGNSHQIFHVFVAACFVAYHGLYVALWQWRSAADTCSNDEAAATCLGAVHERVGLDVATQQ